MIKNLDNRKLIVKKLTNSFNEWASNEGPPVYLKTAKVVPLSKDMTPFPKVGNIRTISILPVTFKLYERLLLNRLE